MNAQRYVVAGAVSLTIHAAFLWAVPEKQAIAMPTGSHSSSVAINLVATPVTKQHVEPTPEKTIVEAPVEQPAVQENIAPVANAKQVVKKPDPKPVKKVKPTPKPVQEVAKKVESKAVKTPPKPPVEKVKPEPKKIEKIEKVVSEQPSEKKEKKKDIVDKTSAPQMAKQGVNNAPTLVEKANVLSTVSPKYPRLAKRRGIEGVAMYEILLDANGKQVKQTLIDSSGTKMLDKAALDAIKKWEFSPHIMNGQAIAHRVHIPVRFTLN